jgi:hypothetical protein
MISRFRPSGDTNARLADALPFHALFGFELFDASVS